MADVVFAKQGGSTFIDGARRHVAVDQPLFANDPLVKAYPDWFDELPADLRNQQRRTAAVEDASGAPGAKRRTRAPKKSTG
jgi:hypothetical protein